MYYPTIRDDADLRLAWDALKMTEGLMESGFVVCAERGGEYITAIKKAIRVYNTKQAQMPERRFFDDRDAGSYRMFFETGYVSVEEAEAEHQPLTCYPDQLGRWFEISHKFFRRSDGVICGYVHNAMNW